MRFQCNNKISEDTFHEISWWKKNIFKVLKPIRYPKVSINICKYTSIEGWSASIGDVSRGEA